MSPAPTTTTSLAELREHQLLGPLDEHFARALGRIANESNEDVLLATALLSRQVERGHVCLDLRRLAEQPLAGSEEGDGAVVVRWPQPERWLAALRDTPLIGGDATPLVLDEAGRLYLRRYYEYQQRLAAAILARVRETPDGLDERLLQAGLERLFPAGPDTPSPDLQRMAAETAVRRRFCVISGGPGTGKTYTVVKILALLLEQAHAAGADLRIALVAPTGKAAARLGESVEKARAGLACSEEVKARIPVRASTIHRCLGKVPGRMTRFRHDAENPLPADVVLVDEASMVDLALMTRLTDALRPGARLILLGDKDQLASVEAGAVLGDICEGVMKEVTGLHHSYRYRADSGIGALARAINAGDGAGTLAALAADSALRLVAPGARGLVDAALLRRVRQQFEEAREASDPAAALACLERLRILCAHRRGPFGVEDVNRQIEAALLGKRRRRADSAYAGQPIMVTENDYQTDLRNGDVGIVLPEGAALRAHFPGEGGVRTFALSRLPPHETVFAMSVHKSQGSEFDAVAVLLPLLPSPLLSRELLYTAVTRARSEVTIYGSTEIVTHATARRIERTFGLRDRLRGAGAPDPLQP